MGRRSKPRRQEELGSCPHYKASQPRLRARTTLTPLLGGPSLLSTPRNPLPVNQSALRARLFSSIRRVREPFSPFRRLPAVLLVNSPAQLQPDAQRPFTPIPGLRTLVLCLSFLFHFFVFLVPRVA